MLSESRKKREYFDVALCGGVRLAVCLDIVFDDCLRIGRATHIFNPAILFFLVHVYLAVRLDIRDSRNFE